MTRIVNTAIYRAGRMLVTRLIAAFIFRRHLGRISGLHNLPTSGPFVIIANHTSNFDQYLIFALMLGLFDRDIKFLIKQDYLEGRLGWIKRPVFMEQGAVPYDRDDPDPVIMRGVLDHLIGGGVLSIFPEGTRGDGVKLLPFMSGPFRLAVTAGVPIIPVGISGTQRILPKNARYPRRGRATVVIGEPIVYARNTALRSYGLDLLIKRARETVESLWSVARAAASDSDVEVRAAGDAVVAAERLIEEALVADEAVARRRALRSARSMLWMARHNHHDHETYERNAARVAALLATMTRWPLRVVESMRAHILASQALRRSPDDPVATQVMGTWHLHAPRLLGASRRKAVALLRRAREIAPMDTSIALALAEALLGTGDAVAARSLLQAVLDAEDAHLDPRRRAEELLGKLARAS